MAYLGFLYCWIRVETDKQMIFCILIYRMGIFGSYLYWQDFIDMKLVTWNSMWGIWVYGYRIRLFGSCGEVSYLTQALTLVSIAKWGMTCSTNLRSFLPSSLCWCKNQNLKHIVSSLQHEQHCTLDTWYGYMEYCGVVLGRCFCCGFVEVDFGQGGEWLWHS